MPKYLIEYTRTEMRSILIDAPNAIMALEEWETTVSDDHRDMLVRHRFSRMTCDMDPAGARPT